MKRFIIIFAVIFLWIFSLCIYQIVYTKIENEKIKKKLIEENGMILAEICYNYGYLDGFYKKPCDAKKTMQEILKKGIETDEDTKDLCK